MLFSEIFIKLLEEDISTSSYTKPYHRATRGLNRKRLQQVPQYARGRGDLNSKVEAVRSGKISQAILSPSDITYIRNRYNIHDFKPGKRLGSTGMSIMQHPMTGGWLLVK